MSIKFDNTFATSAAALRLNQGHPLLPIKLKWAVKILLFYFFYMPCCCALIYSSIYYDNFTKICTNLSLTMVFLVISFNYILLILYKEEFNKMMKTTEENWERSREFFAEDLIVVEEYTAKGKFVTKVWFFVGVLCSGIFIFKAVLATIYSAVVGNFTLIQIYELTYPTCIEERKNELYMYLIIFCSQSFYAIFSAFMFVGFNPLGPIFLIHTCGQIELVIRQIESLFRDEGNEEETAIKKLKDIVRDVHNIYSFVDKIQLTHKALYEMCLNTTMIAVPICCFGIIESCNEGSISIELICYVFGCIMQCYIPCYYCEVLMSKGADLQSAIYGCGWEKQWMPKTRSTILLMMTRAAKPLGIRAVFCTVCLDSFAKCCNQSYSIFNLLNAAWN